MMDHTFSFIGAGNMAEALLRGFFEAGILPPSRCIVTNKSNDERLTRLSRAWDIRTTRDKASLLAESDVVILAVKPHDMPTVLAEVAPRVTSRHLIISVGTSGRRGEKHVRDPEAVDAGVERGTVLGEEAAEVAAGVGGPGCRRSG